MCCGFFWLKKTRGQEPPGFLCCLSIESAVEAGLLLCFHGIRCALGCVGSALSGFSGGVLGCIRSGSSGFSRGFSSAFNSFGGGFGCALDGFGGCFNSCFDGRSRLFFLAAGGQTQGDDERRQYEYALFHVALRIF